MNPEELRAIFKETLDDVDRGEYSLDDRTVGFVNSREQHKHVLVLSEEDLSQVCSDFTRESLDAPFECCDMTVENLGSLEGAEVARGEACPFASGEKPPIVLYFAHPYEPGGGKMHGAENQEENICRRTTVYSALSSDAAREFYDRNRERDSLLFTDGIALVPHAEIFRDASYCYLERPRDVAILACPAPFVRELEGVAEERLYNVIKGRIKGIVLAAITHGYSKLVLGAWGCGAFGNDPTVVARAFREVLEEIAVVRSEGYARYAFQSIVFAIFDRSSDQELINIFAAAMRGW